MVEFNFVHQDTPNQYVNDYLGPITDNDGSFVSVDNTWEIAHCLVHAGIFTSLTQARKNGYTQPFPRGYCEMTVGKKKTRLFFLNVPYVEDEPDELTEKENETQTQIQ